MSHRRQVPSLPESLDTPDVGFVAASGVYAATVLLMVFVTVAFAVGAGASTIVGGVSTATTAGLVVGALLASRSSGLPERLGRGWRSLAVPFAVPVGFGVVSIAAFVSSLPLAGAGAGLGTLATGGVAVLVASMARTRYVRAMTPDEPIATIPRLKPNEGVPSIVVGVLCLATAGSLVVAGQDGGLALVFVGIVSLFTGAGARSEHRRLTRPDRSDEERPRRRLLDTEWGREGTDDGRYLPELQIHAAGIVTERQLERRFVPWTLVTDIRLTPDELVIERRRGFDLRCDRAVIEDAERVCEEIERARTEPEIERVRPGKTSG